MFSCYFTFQAYWIVSQVYLLLKQFHFVRSCLVKLFPLFHKYLVIRLTKMSSTRWNWCTTFWGKSWRKFVRNLTIMLMISNDDKEKIYSAPQLWMCEDFERTRYCNVEGEVNKEKEKLTKKSCLHLRLHANIYARTTF